MAQVGCEEEQEGADELAGGGDEVFSHSGRIDGGFWLEVAEHGLVEAMADLPLDGRHAWDVRGNGLPY